MKKIFLAKLSLKNLGWGRRRRMVYTYVVGDLLHVGHLKYLESAKSLGDYLIVGVLTEEATLEKKTAPTISLNQRMKLINGLECVNKVVAQHEYSPLKNVKKIKPDILVESSSHEIQPANDYVKSYGGKVREIPYYKGVSSSEIKNKIKIN